MADSIYVTFRVPADMHAGLQNAAAINCRNLSAECRAALRAHLEATLDTLREATNARGGGRRRTYNA